MAKERGWWEIKFTVEPSTTDLEHIATLIEQGYTSGEIVEDEEGESFDEHLQSQKEV